MSQVFILNDQQKVTRESVVCILKHAKKLGIKAELIDQGVKKGLETSHLKLSYKNKHYYIHDFRLGRSLDLFSAAFVDNKAFAKKVLIEHNIKVPRGFVANSFSEIKAKIKNNKLDFPLVLKPSYMSEGSGVFPNIRDFETIKKGLIKIRKIKHKYSNRPVIIEEHFSARDFRVLVLNGKFIACTERVAPKVTGNGRDSIEKLMKKQLKTEGIDTITIDSEVERALHNQNIKKTDVPTLGQIVRIRENTNISTGGVSINRTAEICPKYQRIAEKAAQAFGMNLAGVDIMTPDISHPRSDYRVIEVNAMPGFFTTHDQPDIGRSENVTLKILKAVFNIK